MFTVQVRQDQRELALLQRIAEGIEALAPPLEAGVAAGERIAVALENVAQQPTQVVRIIEYRLNNRIVQSIGGSVMFTGKVTDPGIPGTLDAVIKSFKDSEGNPATVDGAPTWEVDNPAVVDNVVVAADGMSAKLHLANSIGACQITIKADVDTGTGVKEQTFVDVVSITAGDAAVAEIEFGTPVPDA